MINIHKPQSNTSLLFCISLIVVFIILTSYLWCSLNGMKDSQEKIVSEHINHVLKVDSLYNEMRISLRDTDSIKNEGLQVLLSQLQKDSEMSNKELLISQNEINSLLTLHLDKIENDYAQIGIWGGILSIIFLIFGFFAIFKIEETKADAKNTLDEVKTQGKKVRDEIKTDAKNTLDEVTTQGKKAINEIKELQDQAGVLNNSYNSIRQNCESLIKDKKTEFDELITNINDANSHSHESLEKINKLLGEVETKSRQYEWSINQMKDLMDQLQELIEQINTSKNNEKETGHE